MALDEFILAADFIWDRANRNFHKQVEAKGGDNGGRQMRVQVTNNNVVENLTGYTLNLGWATKDGLHSGLDAFAATDITQGIFEATFTTGMLSNIGKLTGTLQLVGPGSVIESINFIINVTASPVDGETQEASDSFGALEAALIAANGGGDTAVRLGILQTAVDAIDRGYGGSYASLAALTTAIPAGDTNRYITLDNGHWAYWNSSAWTDGGVFQATAMPAGVKTIAEFMALLKGATTGINLVTNGKAFVDTTGWTTFSATQAVVGGNLVITGTGSGYSGSNFYIGAADAVGTKYYYRYTMRATTTGATKIGIRSSSTAVANTEVASPVQNQWYTKSGGFAKTAAQGSTTNVSPAQYYSNTSGKILEVAEVIAVNLTAIYGAGLEPSYDDFGLMWGEWLSSYLQTESARIDALEAGGGGGGGTDIASVLAAVEDGMAPNMITNGQDFANTSGWTAFQATQAAVGGILVLTGSVAASYSGSNFDVGIGSPTGSKFFYQYEARVRDAGCQKISVRSSSTNVTSMDTLTPTIDVWYTKSGGFTKTAAVGSATNVYPCQFYDSASMVGKILEVKRIAAVDLTALYGSGNEPTYDDFAVIYNNYLSNYLATLDSRLDALAPAANDLAELETVQDEILTKQTGASMDYIFMTDVHAIDSHYAATLALMERAVRLANLHCVDFLCFGGDFIDGAGYHETLAVIKQKFLDMKMICAKSEVPVINLHGNHDDNSINTYNALPAETYYADDFYKTMVRPFEDGYIHDSQKGTSLYYYKDFPTKKMRLVVLDGADYPIVDDGAGGLLYSGALFYGYGARQVTWLHTEGLQGIPTGYKVVLLSHVGFGSSYINGTLVQGILDACHTGGTYTGSTSNADYGVSVSASFTAQGARPLLNYQHGHVHTDGISATNGNWKRVSTNSAATVEQWDITTIDAVGGKVYFTRIGNGVDREITL